MEKNQTIKIESKSLYKTLARVALPIALQSLIASSLNLVDSLMVGSLGETELAAVGLSSQLFFVHWGVLFGFASGSSAFMAQFWGKQDIGSIRKVTGFAVTLCFGISLFFFIPGMFFPDHVLRIFTDIPEAIFLGKGYVRIASICFLFVSITVPFTAALRTTQQTSVPLKISMLVFSTNTTLNYIFIFGKFGAPELGVHGAALATAISRSLELILILYVVFGRKNLIAGRLSEFFGWYRPLAAKILVTAIPVMINETMWSLGMATYNAAYGRMGVTEFAAIQASNTINTMFILAIFSLGDALLILVGQRIGMGEMDYAFALAKRLLRIGICVGAVSGALLIFSSQFIIRLFNFTPEGLHYALLIIAIYGTFMPLKVFNGLNIVGTMRCGGDTKCAMYIEVGSVWLIGVPMVFLGALYLQLPIYFVVLMAQTEEVVKGLICIQRFRSKKWLNNLVHDI
ncbi:MATE family efflux transporter [Sinanaerobacter chloroacetimidivorans]|uniref:MATE family efflux transporter n=1 Tax=Sinanaerobacter chloroacetimidivorans TaxID=2818044 RepID=A0A8J7W786_9FIRM|nr:MATE family efflux transporter [Sinanaerobacter chloroacetimidivorans]MBR0600420.1 MATE family efflux transporter [Sinanaerobacter chloroacetimidivorans]